MRSFDPKVIRVIFASLLLPLLLLLAGCNSFNRQWNQSTAASQHGDIQGPWLGTWKSDTSGHTDKLRCIVTKQEDGTYQARFHAKYHTVMSFGYTVPIQVQPATNDFTFKGEADLGWMAGGVYKYDGRATATNFFSTYNSKYDNGIFQMNRPDRP